MSSTKTYELTILNMDNSNTSLFGVPSTSTYNVDFTSYAGTTAIYSNRLIMRRYQQVYPYCPQPDVYPDEGGGCRQLAVPPVCD
jgi:hypothetical protein